MTYADTMKRTAESHREADAACGREWTCQCGACRIERERLKKERQQ